MVLGADNIHTVLAASVEVTAMTNQKLRGQVAEATEWRDVQLGHLTGFLIAHYEPGPSVSGRTVLIGRRRQGAEYEEVPNWPEDLPLCMAPGGPLEWLIEQVKPWGGSVDLEITLAPPQSYGEGATGYRCAAYTYPDDTLGEGRGENGGEAICHAVLAVKENLDA